MAINKDESAKVTYGDSAKPQKYMAGFSDKPGPQWLSAADLAKLNAYALDLTKAAGLMTAAGYAKGSDGIYAKDGKKLEFELYFPERLRRLVQRRRSCPESAQQLRHQDRAARRDPQPAIARRQRRQLPDRGHGLGIGNPHPQGSFIQALRTHNTVAAAGGNESTR